MREASKRRGRPPKKASERKRNNVTTRLRDETKRALEVEAEKAGHSLSEEIEFRLDQSFSDERARTERLYREAGGSHNYALGKLIVELAHIIEIVAGAGWTDDNYVFDHLMAGIKEAMSRLRRPEESCSPRRGLLTGALPGLYEVLGEAAAIAWLEQIRMSPEPIEEKEGVLVPDSSRRAHEIGAILAPFILLKEDKASD